VLTAFPDGAATGAPTNPLPLVPLGGSVLVVLAWGKHSTTVTFPNITDSVGNSYSGVQNIGSTTFPVAAWFGRVAVTGSGIFHQFTTTPTIQNVDVLVVEVVGLVGTPTVDAVTTGTGSGMGGTVGPTAATTSTKGIAFGVISNGAIQGVINVPPGFTEIATDLGAANNHATGQGVFKLLNAMTPITAAWSWDVSANYSGIVFALRGI
jgi:hypothetical protein